MGIFQPPSGGCVLKPPERLENSGGTRPAAFRRLCVETFAPPVVHSSFRPAAFRRLCVETMLAKRKDFKNRPSRLQAAVC